MEVDVSQTKEPETPSRKRRRSTFPEPVTESTAQKMKKLEDKPREDKNPEPGPSKEVTENVKITEAEVSEVTKSSEKTKETIENTDKMQVKEKPNSLLEKKEVLRVTPIKLVALPRANKQTPKIFTTARVTKSTPGTPTTPGTPVEEDKSMNTSSSKRSKVTKADRFIITEQKDLKASSSRRNSRSNKSLNSIPKQEKTDKSTDKKSDSDASTSKEKPKKRDDTEKSVHKKSTDSHKPMKEEKDPSNKSEDELSLAMIAQENRNSGLPTISNIVSLSTTAGKISTTTTKTTTLNTKTTAANTKTSTPNSKTSTPNTKTTTPNKTAPKTLEITVEANPHSSIFTPTSTSNVGNMKEAVSKLQKLRNTPTTESFVGRVGVKAFARMTSPDINDDVQVVIKPEPIDIEDDDEERQMEKMDLMNACKLQPVNQSQSLRDVRINKVIVTPSIVIKKPGAKPAEPRPRAKKTFPQPKRPEGSELNGKNSMVYIPIQPPNTQPPMKAMKSGSTQHGIPMCVTAGPRPSAPIVSSKCT